MHSEHFLKLAAQMARDEMERLLMHRAALDRVERVELLKSALNAFNQRTFARTDRPHQIEHLPAFLALEGGGMEIADDLGNSAFNAKKLISKKVVSLKRLVL